MFVTGPDPGSQFEWLPEGIVWEIFKAWQEFMSLGVMDGRIYMFLVPGAP
jgi:hypothetical protein